MQVLARDLLRWHLSFVAATVPHLDTLVDAFASEQVASIELFLGRNGGHTVTVAFIDAATQPLVANFEKEADAIMAHELYRQGRNANRCTASANSVTHRSFSRAEESDLISALYGIVQRANFPYETVAIHSPRATYDLADNVLHAVLAGVYSDPYGSEYAAFYLFDVVGNHVALRRVVSELATGYSVREETALEETNIADLRAAVLELRHNTNQPPRRR